MAYQKHNWPELFEQFASSNLSQTEFCKQHDLNPKYFSLKLSKRKANNGGAFSKVSVAAAGASAPTQGLMLEVGDCKVHCPAAMPIPSLASLVKALA